jgi:hypothetical protein
MILLQHAAQYWILEATSSTHLCLFCLLTLRLVRTYASCFHVHGAFNIRTNVYEDELLLGATTLIV